MKYAALVALLVAAPAQAGGCRPFNYVTPSYTTATIYETVTPVIAVKEVLIAAFPIPVAFPYYGSAYAGPAPQGQPAYNAGAGAPEWAQQMLQRMDAIERKVGNGTAPDTGRVPMEKVAPQSRGDDPSPIFAQRCASCHESAVAASKGGGFTLVRGDGGDVSLDGAQVLKVVMKVSSGQMPPSRPLAPAEKSVVQAWGEKVLSGTGDVLARKRPKFTVSLRTERLYAKTEE